MTRDDRLSIDPHICGGQVCIRGTRIPVVVVLDCLAEGMTFEQILDEYEGLDREDILAALEYAAELARGTTPLAKAS